MIAAHVITQGLFFAIVVNGYLFILMITLSPRVWGYADYPPAVKSKVPPQTREERRLAWMVSLPWLLFTFSFPFFSTYALKSKLGGEIPFGVAFLNLFVMTTLATLGDALVLDWLVISRITPKFVIIPGSVKEDYKDFSHHFKGHVKAAVVLVVICVVIASIVSFF